MVPSSVAKSFKSPIPRCISVVPDRDNTIDVYLSDDDMDVLADGIWENFFTEKPERMTREERAEWIKNLDNVTLGSDAFIPFSDNVERANRSGVKIYRTGTAVLRMIRLLLMLVTNLELLWHSQDFVCSITKMRSGFF